MALPTLDGFFGFVGVIPVALAPVVVLILQLNPAHIVDLFIDELLVAGGSVFGSLEKTLAQGVDVVARVGPNQEVP